MIYAWIRQKKVEAWDSDEHKKIITDKADVIFKDNAPASLEEAIEAINYHAVYKFTPLTFEQWQQLNLDIKDCTNINQVRIYHPVKHHFVAWISIQSYLPGIDISLVKAL